MPNSYEHSFQHNLDDVIDASDAVLAIGTEKVDTTTLKDLSLTGNDATIHGAMPSNGYFLGRTFDGDDDYLDCGNFQVTGNIIDVFIIYKPKTLSLSNTLLAKEGPFKIDTYNAGIRFLLNGSTILSANNQMVANKTQVILAQYDGSEKRFYINGVLDPNTISTSVNINTNSNHVGIGAYHNGSIWQAHGDISVFMCTVSNVNSTTQVELFNTVARLPLYSHNFERYPNSDTSLTSVFPYTSGIITSGSFNKTDGLKCTSAGQIIFSNSFEFDGNEYITLVIDGVKYSGTTTVTQGTITATIAQGSNDITIDMGTGDVLPDIRVQFREEV